MTPERWHRITEVFHVARARDVTSRYAYLGEACAGDPALHAEVEAMLAANGEAGRFGDTPMFAVADTAPRFDAGARLGPYDIVAFLAAGGMGESIGRATRGLVGMWR
jgi:eukaryotic-like serine/threonine-protein kinase